MVIAHRLYDDLRLAQEKLVLLNHFHLLYCVTPYTMMEQIRPNNQVFFNVVSLVVFHLAVNHCF